MSTPSPIEIASFLPGDALLSLSTSFELEFVSKPDWSRLRFRAAYLVSTSFVGFGEWSLILFWIADFRLEGSYTDMASSWLVSVAFSARGFFLFLIWARDFDLVVRPPTRFMLFKEISTADSFFETDFS